MTVASSSSHGALRLQRTVRDGQPRMSTSTFTQLMGSDTESSSSVLRYVHRARTDYYRTDYYRTDYYRTDYWERGSTGRPPPLSHSSWALTLKVQVLYCVTSTEPVRTITVRTITVRTITVRTIGNEGAQDVHLHFHTAHGL